MIFFFNDTATTEIYTLSLHDALPILAIEQRGERSGLHRDLLGAVPAFLRPGARGAAPVVLLVVEEEADRKSTRLNSSHANISYAVFCLKKKIILPSICLF